MAKKAKRPAGKKAVGKKAVRKNSPGLTKPAKQERSAPLQRHFEKAGVRFNLTNQEILAEIKKLMGRKRYSVWHSASIDRQKGWGNPAREYEALKTAEEVNTLFSLQSHTSLAVCEKLASRVAETNLDAGRIGDLGCGSGLLAAWLAKQHPGCEVIGFDGVPNMVAAASSSQKAPRLSFRTWDYAREVCPEPHSCDVLVSCFGVDFPIGRESFWQSLDGESLRNQQFCQQIRAFMKPFFRGWRTAIRDSGRLFAVLRISTEMAFVGVVDAAYEEGWHLDPGRCDEIQVGEENFKLLALVATMAPLCSEKTVLSLWCRGVFRRDLPRAFMNAEAICIYRSLATKVISRKEIRTYDDDHTMEALVGQAGYLGFQYTHATTGYARLKLMSLDEAEHADPWFPPPPPVDWLF